MAAVSIPASLLTNLRELVPGFSEEAERHQLALAQMLWHWTNRRRRHHRFPAGISLSKGDLREMWGSDETARKRLQGHQTYFRCATGNNLAGYTNAFIPSTEFHEALQQCLQSVEPDNLISESGKLVRRLPSVIARYDDGKKKTKWWGSTPASSAIIDVDSLAALRRRYVGVLSELPPEPLCTDVDRTGKDKAQRGIDSIDALLRLSRNKLCPGAVPIQYAEKSTGRLFARGTSLQSVQREVRHAALAGCWDYDIANCHWAFLLHLAHAAGHACPNIEAYLSDKRGVRRRIADAANITIDEAKECLLIVLQGGKATDAEDASLAKLIGKPKAALLLRSPDLRLLMKEVRRVREKVLAKHPRLRGGWISNAMGLRMKATTAAGKKIRKPPNARRRLAHLLQGLEARALKAVVDTFGEEIVLCVHDGWVSRSRLDCAQLERLILDAIGVNLTVEEKRLEAISAEASATMTFPSQQTAEAQQTCGPQLDSLHSCAPNGYERREPARPPSAPSPPPPDPFAEHAPGTNGSLFVYGHHPWTRRERLPPERRRPRAAVPGVQESHER